LTVIDGFCQRDGTEFTGILLTTEENSLMQMFGLLSIFREELERWKAIYQRENFQQTTVNGH